jgi:hypothetical protein
MTIPKLKKEKLDKSVHFRCSKKEYKLLQRNAQSRFNVTISDVIRHCISLLKNEKNS